MFAYYIRLFYYSIARYHFTDPSPSCPELVWTIHESVTVGYAAGLNLAITVWILVHISFPVWAFSLPFIHSVVFCSAELISSGYTRVHCLMALVIIGVMGCDVLRQQRRTFCVEV